MVRVRSFDTYVGVEIKLESVWGTDPGSWGTASYQVPFVSESFLYDDEVFPDSQEFVALGALLDIEKGRRIVRGSLVCEPQFNNIYFWTLFSQVWGTENLVVDRSIFDDTAVETGLNTHIWTPGSGPPIGLAARVFMSGDNQSGYIKRVNGMLVTSMEWVDPTGDRPRCTFNWIAKTITTEAATAQSLPTLEDPNIKFKATDLQRTGSVLAFGATQTALNVTGFTLRIDRGIEVGDAFKNSILDIDKPGIVRIRDVELSIDSVLEQDFNAANKPWKEFSSDPEIASKATIAYEADTDAVSGTPYAMRFDMPRLRWTSVEPTLSQLGEQPFRAVGRATRGALTDLTAPYDQHTGIPTDTFVDIRALCHVAEGDEPSTDAKFSTLGDAA